MRRFVFASATALALASLGSAPALAQDAQQQQQQEQQQTTRKAADPNEVVCEKQQETGSRLMSHEVCMTRGQWMEQRRQERMDIDKAQIERPMQN